MKFSPTPFNDNGGFKRGDWWNVAQFLVLSLLLMYWFDHFLLEPKREELAAQRLIQEEAIANNVDPVEPARPRAVVLKESQRFELSNDDVTASIALTRGNMDDVALKSYFTELDQKEQIHLLSPAGTAYPLYTETGWSSDVKTQGMPDKFSVWHVVGRPEARSLTLTWSNTTGQTFLRTFTLDDQYVITVRDVIKNEGTVPTKVWPYALISQHGLPEHLSGGIVHEGAIGYVGDNFIEYSYGELNKRAIKPVMYTGTTGWVGITSRYFMVGLIPDQKESIVYRAAYTPPVDPANKNDKPRYQMDAQGIDRMVAPGGMAEFTTRIFVGPKRLRMLESYGNQMGLKHFDLAVDFGWFYFLTKPFYYAIVFINDMVGNFGVAILLLTLAIKLAVFPLANASFRSFAKMKLVGPQVQELQKTYAADKHRLQQELVKLYQKEKVNPLSGCLPIFAQIPIFFAIYKVINVSIEMRHAPFFGWIQDLSAPDPTSIINLYGALPFDVHSWFHFGVYPTLLFIMIMLQVRLSPPPPDRMMYIFFSYYYPVIVCYTMSKFAAGLVIYWAFSAFLSISQQIFIMRSLNVPIHFFDNLPWAKKKQEARAIATVIAEDVIDAVDPVDQPPEPDLPDRVQPKNKKK